MLRRCGKISEGVHTASQTICESVSQLATVLECEARICRSMRTLALQYVEVKAAGNIKVFKLHRATGMER